MTTTCPKCSYERTPKDIDIPATECPRCGVIYAKAQPPAPRPAPRTAPAAPLSTLEPAEPQPSFLSNAPSTFLDELRERSHYPAFRSVVTLVYLLGIVVAVVALVGSLVALFVRGQVVPGIIGLVAACFIFLIVKAGKEASLMVADLSDATIFVAKHQRPHADD